MTVLVSFEQERLLLFVWALGLENVSHFKDHLMGGFGVA